jgi:hypothetical protein
MARIRCHYLDCAFLDDSFCSAAQVEIDPDAGCTTYSPNEETAAEDGWDENDEEDEWEDLEDEEEEEEGDWKDGEDNDEI